MSIFGTPWLEQIFCQKDTIEAWFEKKWLQHPPPFYTSVDLRWSGFKLSPVDTNLFPAGFNNLSDTDTKHAVKKARTVMQTLHAGSKNILILSEAHTRNQFYLENVISLEKILTEAGFSVKIAPLSGRFFEANSIAVNDDRESEGLQRTENYLHVGDFIPDCILLNHDLSEGWPELLKNLTQPVFPKPTLGWHQRKKSRHFHFYQRICQEFCDQFHWDIWQFNPLFDVCDAVDFMDPLSMQPLSEKTQQLLMAITRKYQAHQISTEPYVVIKADSGTYGMGVLTIKNAEELLHLPRKIRSHMIKTKGKRPIHRVLLQEGIPTINTSRENVAEPVVYLFGNEVIGGFYRSHRQQTAEQNLNAPGMLFDPVTFSNVAAPSSESLSRYAYGVVARLAVLAASLELKEASLSIN